MVEIELLCPGYKEEEGRDGEFMRSMKSLPFRSTHVIQHTDVIVESAELRKRIFARTDSKVCVIQPQLQKELNDECHLVEIPGIIANK